MYITSLHQLSQYYYFVGDFKNAMNLMNKVVSFVAQKDGKQSVVYATAIFNQAMLYKEIGNDSMALKKIKGIKDDIRACWNEKIRRMAKLC